MQTNPTDDHAVFRPFDPVRFPADEMKVVGALFVMLGAGLAVVRGSIDAGFVGWWMAVTVAFVMFTAYADRYIKWFVDGLTERGLIANTAAGLAPLVAAGTVKLPEDPISAPLGFAMVLPFFAIAERWRRERAAEHHRT